MEWLGNCEPPSRIQRRRASIAITEVSGFSRFEGILATQVPSGPATGSPVGVLYTATMGRCIGLTVYGTRWRALDSVPLGSSTPRRQVALTGVPEARLLAVHHVEVAPASGPGREAVPHELRIAARLQEPLDVLELGATRIRLEVRHLGLDEAKLLEHAGADNCASRIVTLRIDALAREQSRERAAS